MTVCSVDLENAFSKMLPDHSMLLETFSCYILYLSRSSRLCPTGLQVLIHSATIYCIDPFK